MRLIVSCTRVSKSHNNSSRSTLALEVIKRREQAPVPDRYGSPSRWKREVVAAVAAVAA